MNASFLLVLGLLVTPALTSDEKHTTALNPHKKFDSDKNNVTNMTTASSGNHGNTNNSLITLSTQTADVENETSAATPTTSLTTEEAIVVLETTELTTGRKKHELTTIALPVSAGSDTTGIIITSLIVIVALGFGVGCYISHRKGSRNSVDFTSRPNETNIPLNAEVTPFPDVFVPPAIADPDKSVVDPGAESVEPPPDICDDDPKEEAGQQQSPPPPVTVAGDENNASKKSSAESLQETTSTNNHKAD